MYAICEEKYVRLLFIKGIIYSVHCEIGEDRLGNFFKYGYWVLYSCSTALILCPRFWHSGNEDSAAWRQSAELSVPENSHCEVGKILSLSPPNMCMFMSPGLVLPGPSQCSPGV